MSIYLDHNSTTHPLPEAKEAATIYLNSPSNPSSIHAHGREARTAVELSRKTIMSSLNANPQEFELIFTASGTEANNLIMHGAHQHLFVSAIEHASLIEPAKHYKNAEFIPVNADGLVNLDWLDARLADDSNVLVSVGLANNEIGVIQNLAEVSRIAHKHKAIVHTDATQAFGKVNVDIEELGVDLVTVTAHKMGGICGSAAIIKRKNIQLLPLMHGGGQEKGLRPGTENIPAIVGFGVAASKADELVSRFQAIQHLRDEMEDQLCNFAPQVKVYGQTSPRLPNTSCITMPNVSNELQLIALDLKGISVSAGSACSSGKVGSSHVLQAMGVEDAQNAIRVSLGLNNTKGEVLSFIEAWKEIYIKHHQAQVISC